MLLVKIYYGTTPQHSHFFYQKYYYTKEFPSMVREPVLRPGALSHQMGKVRPRKINVLFQVQNFSRLDARARKNYKRGKNYKLLI